MKMLSKDFSLKEFTDKGFPSAPSIMAQFLLDMIVGNLQLVRDLHGETISIRDCYRSKAKFSYLLGRGLHPSMTSDHFYGQEIPIDFETYHDLYVLYRGVYSLSVGALDIFSSNNNKLFNSIRKFNEHPSWIIKPFGQVIYEQTDNSSWVHISNNIRNVYGPDFIKWLRYRNMRVKEDNMYLYSTDGGANYTKVTGDL